MKKFFLVFLAFFGFFCFAFGEEFGFNSLKEMAQKPIIGEFKQTRSINSEGVQITSYGEFSLKNNELLWLNKKPIANLIKINNQGVFSFLVDERSAKSTLEKAFLDFTKSNDTNSPKWENLGADFSFGLFLGLFSLDENKLQEDFSLKLSGNFDKWNLLLTPRSVLIRDVIKSIEISGGADFSKDSIEQKGKNTIKSKFNAVRQMRILWQDGSELKNEFFNIKSI